MAKKYHKYTKEHINYIKEICEGKTDREVADLFNEKFKTNLYDTQITAARKRHGIKKDYGPNSGHFKKGCEAWNKGKKTNFKPTNGFHKGHTRNIKHKIGAERVRSREKGQSENIEIKIDNPNVWKAKQRVIWEEHNGPIPKGYAVIFGDGNNRNFDISNLILVTRGQLASLNAKKMIQQDADLTRAAIAIGDIEYKLNQLEKGIKK